MYDGKPICRVLIQPHVYDHVAWTGHVCGRACGHACGLARAPTQVTKIPGSDVDKCFQTPPNVGGGGVCLRQINTKVQHRHADLRVCVDPSVHGQMPSVDARLRRHHPNCSPPPSPRMSTCRLARVRRRPTRVWVVVFPDSTVAIRRPRKIFGVAGGLGQPTSHRGGT